MPTIAENYQRLRAGLNALNADKTTVIVVAKTFPAAMVKEAAAAGATDVGENYLQEAAEKIAACAGLPLTWHFIGGIQKNKTSRIARLFDWAHGVDRLSIAERLAAARDGMTPLNVCLQVNISDEKNKNGVNANDAAALAAQVAALPNLRLRGLMAIPAEETDPDKQLAVFRRLADLKNAIRLPPPLPPLDVLSMGMSQDYQQAVRAGATHIRLGTAIFGHREKKP